jgi:hypothetical protein
MGMARGRSLFSPTVSCDRNVAVRGSIEQHREVITRIFQIGTISSAPLRGANSKPHPLGADSLLGYAHNLDFTLVNSASANLNNIYTVEATLDPAATEEQVLDNDSPFSTLFSI